MKKYILLYSLILLVPSFCEAGAWTQKEGEGTYRFGFRVYRASEFLDPGGNRLEINLLSSYSASFSFEYGITDTITLTGYAPFYERLSLAEQVEPGTGVVLFSGDSESGFADSSIGFRWRFTDTKGFLISAGVSFGIPVGRNEQENGLLTGDGEWNQFLSLQLSRSFYPRPFYFSAGAGFNNRTDGYSDELHFSLDAGYSIHRRWSVSGQVRTVQSVKNGEDAVTGGVSGLYSNNQSYFVFGGALSFRLVPQHSISFGIEKVADGENVLTAPSFSVGFSGKF